MAFRILVDSPPDRRAPDRLLRAAVEAALRSAGLDGAQVSLALLADESIRALNRTWLEHDWVPDVLSFALHDEGQEPVGDIYIGVDQAARQAREHGVTVDEELVRLAIHGTLHVLGGDHPASAEERERSAFFERQEALVSEVMGEHGSLGPSFGERAPGGAEGVR